jgi:hypothetical protein
MKKINEILRIDISKHLALFYSLCMYCVYMRSMQGNKREVSDGYLSADCSGLYIKSSQVGIGNLGIIRGRR